MQIQAKECWQPPQAGRDKEEILLWGLQRACSQPDALISAQRYELWTFGLQNCEKINFCCFSHLLCGNLLQKTQVTNADTKSILNSFMALGPSICPILFWLQSVPVTRPGRWFQDLLLSLDLQPPIYYYSRSSLRSSLPNLPFLNLVSSKDFYCLLSQVRTPKQKGCYENQRQAMFRPSRVPVTQQTHNKSEFINQWPVFHSFGAFPPKVEFVTNIYESGDFT